MVFRHFSMVPQYSVMVIIMKISPPRPVLAAPKHPFGKLVMEHETNSLHRVSDELLEAFQFDINEDTIPKSLSAKIKMEMKRRHQNSWLEKVQHGYLFKQRQKIKEFENSETNAWLKYSTVSSHVDICVLSRKKKSTRSY